MTEHKGVLYHGGNLRYPFKHVTVQDVALWRTLSPTDMLGVWRTKIGALGLTELPGRYDKHDVPQDKNTFATEFNISDDIGNKSITPEKVVMLYAYSIEWLCTITSHNVSVYNEVVRHVAVEKECRGLFRMTFTIYLYGSMGG